MVLIQYMNDVIPTMVCLSMIQGIQLSIIGTLNLQNFQLLEIIQTKEFLYIHK